MSDTPTAPRPVITANRPPAPYTDEDTAWALRFLELCAAVDTPGGAGAGEQGAAGAPAQVRGER